MKNIFTILLVLAFGCAFGVAGDDCSTAILISSSGCSAAAAYNNTGITGTLTPPSCFTTGNNNGMWFSFVASSVNVSVTVTGTTLTTPQIAIMAPPATGCANGATFTELGCSSPGTATATVSLNGALTVGSTYYVYVDGQNNVVGTFKICLTSPQVPTNDAPCNAITPPSLTNWCSPTGAYTTVGSTPDLNPGPACFNSTTPNDVWFQFTPTQIAATITVNGGTGGIAPEVALLQVTGGCTGGTFGTVVCGAATTGQTTVTISTNFLVPGQTYYVVVSAEGADGPFSICINNYPITSTVPNDQCPGAIPVCPGENYSGSTEGATSTNDIPIDDNNGDAIWQCNGIVNNAIWYTFVATSPPQNAVFNVNWDSYGVDGYPGGAIQFEVFDYTGPGAACAHDASTVPGYWTSLTNINDLPCEGASTGPGTEIIPAASLIAGRTYYILIDNFPDDTVTYSFTGTGIAGTSAGKDTIICAHAASFNFSGFTPAGGTWSGPGITNTSLGTFNPTSLTTGVYTVYYTANGCTDAKQVTIEGPTVTTSADVTICQGGSTTLDGNVTEYPGSAPVTFTNSTAYSITGGGSASSVIAVSGINPNTVATNPILSVCLDVGAEYSDDDKITLKCPGGTTMTLVPYNNSGTLLSGFSGTCFVTGSPSITTGTPPYSGSFAPSQAFTTLNACIVDGNWTLKVTNDDAFDLNGAIADWSITFNNVIPNPNYTWTPTTNMTNSTTLSPTVTPTVTTSYVLTATDTIGCIGKDTVKVTVTPKPNAGADQTVCQNTTATMAASGTGTWVAISGNPATAAITTPSSPTTSITALTVAGAYYFEWGSGTCYDTAIVNVVAKPNAGPDQTVTCYPTNTSTTMAGTGTGTWSALSTNPTPAPTITTPTSATTTITGFSAAGTYHFVLSNGSCTDTAVVTVTTKPNAGPDQTICQYTNATMAASGTGTWTAQTGNPTPAPTITTPASATTAITGFNIAGTYHFIWTSGSCTDTAAVIVTSKPNAGTDQTICQYTNATMAAAGTGTWSALSTNPTPAPTITTPTSATTTITGFNTAGAYSFIWTSNGCTDTVIVNVTAKPNAGTDQIVTCYPANTTATMAATGTGVWSVPIGNAGTANIVTPTSATTAINAFSVAGTYHFVWTSGGCTDTATVTVTTKPNAGPDQTTCQYTSATMAATGTGTWTAQTGNPTPAPTITTPASATTTITGFNTAGTYHYIWTSGSCSDTAAVIVTAKPNAGIDQTICQYTSATMAATGTGTWSALPTNPTPAPTITTPTSATTNITGFNTAGAYSFVWTSNGCTDTVVVNVTAKPNAGADQTICQYTNTTMAATGIGTWSALSTNPTPAPTITTPTSATTNITGFNTAGAYSFVWTSNGCTDTVVVNVTAKPNAGTDQTICQYTNAAMSATGTGTWSALSTNPTPVPTITTPTSATTAITGFNTAGSYSFVWTSTGCTDTVVVTVTAKPNAGADQTICQYTNATMAAAGTGTWSALTTNPTPAPTITTPTSATTAITGFNTSGAYSFVWTSNGCTDTMIVNVTAKPNGGPDQTVTCYPTNTSATMAGTGTGTWTAFSTNPTPAPTITTPTLATTTITSFSVAGVYHFIWANGSCTDTVTVTVTTRPNAGPDQTICQYTNATMAALGIGTWSALSTNPTPAPTITTPASATTTITGFNTAGTYQYIWTSGSCSDTAAVIVTAKPNAGIDQTICQYTSATMAATGTGTWSALPTNPTPAPTITTPTSATTNITGFNTAGAYSFVWTSNGCTDTVVVNVTAKPNAGADQTICQYTNTTMAATGIGTWSALSTNPTPAPTITTPTSATTNITGFNTAGAYSFVWTSNGCTDTVVVNVTAKPNAGTDQTICQYTNAAMSATGTGTWSALSTNPTPVPTITTPTSATTAITGFNTAGSYSFVWTSTGCTDTVVVTVTAKPNAGADQTICQYTNAAMSATGTGTWSALSTNPTPAPTITTPTSATTAITGFNTPGAYSFVWTSTGCTDTVMVTVTAKPNAGADQTICQYTNAAMAAVGTGTWSALYAYPAPAPVITTPSSATTTITGFSTAGTYSFVWVSNGCSDTMNVNVTAKPNAGADQTICQYTNAAMSATGTGTWSALSTNPTPAPTITTPTSATTAITGFNTPGAYSFVWTSTGCTDTTVVNVTAKPNAGTDQTICQYTSATMAATGTGTWSSLSTNPTPAPAITTPTSATTAITGFNTAGSYSFVWTSNGCADTTVVNVTAKPDAGTDQTICQYTDATMAGVGTGTWSEVAGDPTPSPAITSPSSSATTITGFSAAGVYNFVWTVNGCTDTMIVTVTAKPNAGADQTICQYTSATMAATGTGTWSALSTNPTPAPTITTPTSATTAITGFNTAGSYSFVWTSNGCADTTVVNVTAKPDAGTDQTICQYTDATMAGVGTGTWSEVAGDPTPSPAITSPSSSATTITGFSAAGVYNFVWTVNGCTDTMIVTVTAKPNAGADQTICQYTSATMVATGTGTWSALSTNPTPAPTITTPTSATTAITDFNTAGAYSFVWTSNGCTDTMVVTVTAKPDAGADQTICQYTDAAMAAVGTGTWSALYAYPAPAPVITTPSSATTTITGFSTAGTYSFVWVSNGCSDTMDVNVTAKPDAGGDQTICQNTSVTLDAVGSGTWSDISTNPATVVFASNTDPATSVSGFTIAGVYDFVWTVNGCTDTVAITVSPTPDAGVDQQVCINTQATMAATGAGTWSTPLGNPATTTITTPSSPTTTINGFSVAGTYIYVWVVNGCTDTVNVVVSPDPVAGPDQNICQYNAATMNGTGAGTWTALLTNPATTTIASPTSPTTSITGFDIAGPYYFVFTFGSCTDTMKVTVIAKPDAGADQTICQYTNATAGAIGTGTWAAQAGNPTPAPTITTPSSATTTISGFATAGVYHFIWRSGGCSDTMAVTVTAKPDAGTDQTICQYTDATMSGTGTGTWSEVTGDPTPSPSITSPSSATTTITGFAAAGIYNFVWTVNGCTDTMIVNVTAKPDAGADQTICQYTSAAMTAAGVVGDGTWTEVAGINPSATVIASPTDPATIITGFDLGGPYNFVWTVNGCTDTVTVNVTAKPDAGPDQTICQNTSATMAASGSGTWTVMGTNPEPTSFSSLTDPDATVSGYTVPGAYSYVWTVNGCTDTVTINASATPDAGPDQNVCQNTSVTMAATGTGIWSGLANNPTTATIIAPNQSNTNITGLSSPGVYGFVWNVNGCTDTMDVYVDIQPTVSVADSTICAGDSTTMIAVATPTGGSYLWTDGEITSGIRVSPSGNTPYSVTYTLGICTAQATGNVTVNGVPILNVTTQPTICTTNNGAAEANVTGNSPYTYSWSTSGSTDTITGLAIGPYTVTVKDVNGCSATASGSVGNVTATIPVNLVSLHDLKCYNDNTGNINVTAIDSGTIGYLWNNQAAIQNISQLAAGTYQVTATDQFGCTGTGIFTITQPQQLVLSTPTYTNPLCHGGSDGTAYTSATGGSGNYAYSWNTTPVQNTQQATGLAAGPYTVSVTDDSSCVATASVTISDPASISFATPIVTNTHCYGSNDGTAQVVPQGGAAPYQYQWSDILHQTTNPATGLGASTYTVTVTDANGCTAMTTVTVGQPTATSVSVVSTDLTCFGNSSGTATATGAGGTGPYTYIWNNSDQTQQISNLQATTYTVTATDANACTASASTTLNQPTQSTVAATAVSTNCAASTDGAIYASARGGTGSFTYSLEDVVGDIIQSNDSGHFTGLGPDAFTVVATDQNGCSASTVVNVPHPPFDVYSAMSDSTSCYGKQYTDGQIHLQGYTIANGPFQYSVDGSQPSYTPDYYNLGAGPHVVHATDAHGCDTTFTVIVGEPLPASVDILPGDSTIVLGTNLQLSTAFRPYSMDSIKSYAWSPGEGLSCIDCSNPVVSPYGTQNVYTVTVTYNQGCIATAVVKINVEGDPPLYVPNAFTPNGDGTNDVFYVYGEGIKTMKLTVFNRWGEKVYESDNQSDGWDGTYKGQLQPPGVYVYVLNAIYLNDHTKSKEGSITLIR